MVLRNARGKYVPSWKRRTQTAIKSVLGLSATASILTFQTTAVAHQDVASLVSPHVDQRWLLHIEQQPGQTIVPGNLGELASHGVDPIVTGKLTPSIKVSKEVRNGRSPERVNRAAKGPRVVQTTARQAPVNFSAGSVLERHSLLESLKPGKKFALEFLTPKPHHEALQVAAAFHANRENSLGNEERLPVVVADLVRESRDSILAYAPEPEIQYSPFSAVLRDEQQVTIVPKLGKGDHAWAAEALPKNSFSERQQNCLARGIYFEARGEPVRGQAAVAQVILNRVKNPHYPNTICGVVYQNKHWRNRCQFSFACDRIRDNVRNQRLWDIAKHVAGETTAGRIWLPNVGSSTHYHATYVRPRWARSMKRVGKIGLHIFYRTYGGGWS